MKLRPVAAAETVRGLLQDKLEKYQSQLGLTNSRLEELNAGGILFNPSNESTKSALKTEVQYLEADIQETKDKLIIISSHKAPAIAVEFDL